MANDLIKRHKDNIAGICSEAFRRLTSREPSDRELVILNALYHDQFDLFKDNPKQAAELLGVGQAATPTFPDGASAAAAQHAAVTVLVNSIMNFDESVRHQ